MEGNGDVVAEADVVDQNRDVEVRDQAPDTVEVFVLVGGEVHGDSLRLDVVLFLNLRGEIVELALGARNEQDVEALLRQLESVLLSETVRGASNESPGALLAELGELVEC